MRTLLLSLKPEVFQTVLSGEKIYEHIVILFDKNWIIREILGK